MVRPPSGPAEALPPLGWFAPLLLFAGALSSPLSAQESQVVSPNFIEKLGDVLPADIELYDEEGQPVLLGELIDRPTILSLVYFDCPGICTPLLNEICDVLGKSDLDPAEMPFQLLTVSFEPTDSSAMAKLKRDNYLAQLSRPLPTETWRFMTASAENVERLTGGVGFVYKRTGAEYIHPGGIVILSPERKIVRYFYGTEFLPFDFKMGVVEAARGNVLPTTARVLRFCYSYDPAARGYVFNITRVVAIVMLTSLAASLGAIFFFMRHHRRKAA